MDRPPPTHRSKPGPCSGCTVPTKETSLISGATSWLGWPVSAVLNLRGRLEKSGLPMKRSKISSSALVPSMISSLATPATGEPRKGRGRVAAGLGAAQPGGVEPVPDLRHVLDPDPVELDVLAVGDVGGVTGEVDADAAEGTHGLARQQAAVGADAEHEVLVVQLLLLEHRGLAAVEAGSALGVEAHPPEPAAQVGRVDRGEAALGVDVEDAGPHVERVVVLLGLLVLVQRLGVAERPLTLGALGARDLGVGCRL